MKNFNCSNPRLDIKWSRMHRPHRHYGHRSHRLRNLNHLDNLKLLNESPLIAADYQYQASTDQSDLNLVAMSNNRNHRKRHAQQRIHTSYTDDEQHRVTRSLSNTKRDKRNYKNNTKRKFVTQLE